jgi:hypothetical protein
MDMDVVEQLMKESTKGLRKYRGLQRRHLRLINDIMSVKPGDPRQPELEREKRLVLREMAELSGPLYTEISPARRDGAHP